MPPRIVLSHCLQRQRCRYDARQIESPVALALAPYVVFLTVCPEVAIGLPTPRPPIQLEQTHGEIRLVRPLDGRDFSEPMRSFTTAYFESHGALDGFLLKSRSPSCGVGDTPRFRPGGGALTAAHGDGLFAGGARERFPLLPLESEQRLCDESRLDHFLVRLFALASARVALASDDIPTLTTIHQQLRWVISGYSASGYQRLTRCLASDHGNYLGTLAQTMVRRPSAARWRVTLSDWLGEHKGALPTLTRRHVRRLSERRDCTPAMARRMICRWLLDAGPAEIWPTISPYPLALASALSSLPSTKRGYREI